MKAVLLSAVVLVACSHSRAKPSAPARAPAAHGNEATPGTTSSPSVPAGSPGDPNDPATWIAMLDAGDPAEVQKALEALERINDPVAVGPLLELWRAGNRSGRMLELMVHLTKYRRGGRKHWDEVLSVLHAVVSEVDESDARSIELASLAGARLHVAPDPRNIEVLIAAVDRRFPSQSPAQEARMSALRALWWLGHDERVVDSMLRALSAPAGEQPIEMHEMAARQLGDTRNPRAILPLLRAMYTRPTIRTTCRIALAAMGKPVIPLLIEIVRGRNQEMNALAREQRLVDCSLGMGPDTICTASGMLVFAAAQLLGDLRAQDAVGALRTALNQKPVPAFFGPDGAPGPTQHHAILEALGKIAAPGTAAWVWQYALARSTEPSLRALAIETYSLLTTETRMLPALAKLFQDSGTDKVIRLAAIVAYGRLARTRAHEAPLRQAIAVAQRIGTLEQQALELALTEALAALQTGASCDRDPSCWAAAIGRLPRFTEEEMQTGDYRPSGEDPHDRDDFDDPDDRDDFDDPNDPDFLDDEDPDADQKEEPGAQIAAAERALLELGKMGAAGGPAWDAISRMVESAEPRIRSSSLWAMARVSALPCQPCVDRLGGFIDGEQRGSPLNVEAQAAHSYFLGAGRD